LVVAAVAVGGEAGSEPLGVNSLGAGGVPGALLLAGDRVGAFVDDRVPAVALAGYVSLHLVVSF
jgi:hypothetical protein